MNFKRKLNLNLKKYRNKKRTKTAILKLFNETVTLVFEAVYYNGLIVSYKNEKFVLHTKNPKPKFKIILKSVDGNHGQYAYLNDTHIIELDSNYVLAEDHYPIVSKIILHETIHAVQRELLKTIHDYSRTSIEYKYLKLLRANFLGPDNSSSDFKNPINKPIYISDYNTTIGCALYELMPIERFASLTSSKQYETLFKNKAAEINYILEAVQFLKKRYNCPELTIQQVYEAIDEAITNLQDGKNAMTSIVEKIMYDIFILLYPEFHALNKNNTQQVHFCATSNIHEKNVFANEYIFN